MTRLPLVPSYKKQKLEKPTPKASFFAWTEGTNFNKGYLYTRIHLTPV